MFEIKSEDGKARTGILKINGRKINTPFYMPVGTKATVKNLHSEELEKTKTECIIANSYILSFKPGEKIIQKMGGLHKFMRWDKGIFTDSGGFQIVAPGFSPEINDKGVKFTNPMTNERKLYTPEKAMQVQIDLDSDVAMVLDHVPLYRKDYEYQKEAMIRTKLWAERCLKEHKRLKEECGSKQLLFGIAQGGVYSDLRIESAKHLCSLDFDGLAYGGLAFGEPSHEMFSSIRACNTVYPKEKMKYLMGVGSPQDMLNAIGEGIDAFDSIYPTRNARRGSLFTKNGSLKILSGKYKDDESPIEEDCKCFTCKKFSKSYVKHLLDVKENLGYRLATIHNIYFVQEMIANARKEIKQNNFDEFRKDFLANFVNRNTNGQN